MAGAKAYTSDLSDFLKNTLFEKWKKDRKPLERKWRKNENAFNMVSEGIWKVEEGEDWRSNTFVPATKIKVLSAYSMILDIILQGGVLPFSLEIAPWDSVILEDLSPEEQQMYEDDIDDMTKLIKQQVLDCNGDRETMKIIMSMAKLGEAYWHSYVHDVTRKGFQKVSMAPPGTPPEMARQYTRFERFEKTFTSPAFEYDSCWDIFRDLETDDMQKSQGYCKREFVSPYDLRQLIGKPYYFTNKIETAIKEYGQAQGKSKDPDSEKPKDRKANDRYNCIEKLIFWCRVPRKMLEAFLKEMKSEGSQPSYSTDFDNDGDEVEIGAVMAGEEIIRLIPNVPEGTRPHGRVVWEDPLDDDHGIGVADNLEQLQGVLNGMVRAFEDNKKLSANIILAIKKSLINEWDGKFKVDTVIDLSEEARSAAEAIQQIIIQDVGQSLLAGIGLIERYIDEATLLPKIMQGAIHDKQKVDTLGEIQILMTNSGKYLGSVIKNIDEGLSEPIVSRFYEYNMLDTELQQGKGSYIAKATGFAGYQEKVVKLQKVMQALNLVLNSPAIQAETKLKPLLQTMYKGLDIEPESVFKTPQEKQGEQQAAQQAQSQALEMQAQIIMANMGAEAQKEIKKINAQHEAKMAEITHEYAEKMKLADQDSNNKIIQDKVRAN